MRLLSTCCFFIIVLLATGCKLPEKEVVEPIDDISRNYIQLTLSIGQLDPNFVDSYYGPEELIPTPIESTDSSDVPFEELKWKATELHIKLEELDISRFDSVEILRYRYLVNQLIAVKTKLDMISGEYLPFDVESRSLYDAVAPHYDESYFNLQLQRLDKLLPGNGEYGLRYKQFMDLFIIPEHLVDTVYKVAITEARNRTMEHIDLPEGENFVFEYVSNEPWTGYNRYQGNGQSLVQINTDFPMTIDKAIHLACHEGYPGHHVYNVMLEKHLVDNRGWLEFSIYPLFSPQSLISEGSANFGVDVAFTKEERRNFERTVLFPLAGLDPAKVDLFYDIQEIKSALGYSDNEAARRYLDRNLTREETINWLVKYNLQTPELAHKRIDFYDKYRSYVINYNHGRDLIQNFVERNGGTSSNIDKRWALFEKILSNPISASMIE